MTTRNVLFLGSYGVGKTTILNSFGEASECLVHSETRGGIRVLRLELFGQDISFHAIPGVTRPPDSVLTELFELATVVVYVLSAEPHRQDEQISDYLATSAVADAAGRNWRSVPWIVLLNFWDKGQDMTALARFPSRLRNECICTRAHDAEGLPTLWERIQQIP